MTQPPAVDVRAADRAASYRPDIDGLRGLAILLVVVYHAFPQALAAGFVGVDIFFVISGFLISAIIFRERDAGRFTVRSFYQRRINRLFPALLVVMVACLAFGLVLQDADLRSQTGKHVAAGAVFVQNLVLLGEAGYFDVEARAKPLLHLWSLAVEEQFYLFWPLLFALAAGRAGRRLLLLIVLVGSFAINLWLSATHPALTYYLPVTRFWELALGGVLALEPRVSAGHALNPAFGRFGSAAGLTLLVAGLLLTRSEHAFPDWVGLLPTIGTALIIAAGSGSWINRRVLAARPAVLLGLISYPLYLWHWPLLSGWYLLGGGQAASGAALALAGSFLLAWLTYRWLELPLRRFGSVRGRAAGLAAAMGIVFVVAIVSWQWPGTADAGGGAKLETYRKDWQVNAACMARYGRLFEPRFRDEQDFCIAGPAGAARTVFVVGDSHANRLAIGLQRADPATNYVNLARGNCLPFLGMDGALDDGQALGCQPTADALLRTAMASPEADAIIVTAYFVRPFNGEFRPLDRDVDGSVARTIRRLGESRKRVVLMLDVPTLPMHPRRCLPVPEDGAWRFPPCRLPREVHERQTAQYGPQLRALAAPYPNIRIFDPAPLLCDERYCYGSRERKILYWDPNHVNSDTATMIGRELAKLLADWATTRQSRPGRGTVATASPGN